MPQWRAQRPLAHDHCLTACGRALILGAVSSLVSEGVYDPVARAAARSPACARHRASAVADASDADSASTCTREKPL